MVGRFAGEQYIDMEAFVTEVESHALLRHCLEHVQSKKQHSIRPCSAFVVTSVEYIPSVCTRDFLGLPFGYLIWDIVVENTRIYEFAVSQR